MFHLNCSMAVAVSRMEEGFYLSTAGNVQDFLKSRIWLHTYRFFLKDNTRCGSCIYLTRMNSKIVLSPKIHGKSFENTEMPERMKVQNLILWWSTYRPAGRFSFCDEKILGFHLLRRTIIDVWNRSENAG